MIKYKFDDSVEVEEMFNLMDVMCTVEGEKFPAKNVFHTSLRCKAKESRSLKNSVSVTARNDEGQMIGFLKLVTDHSYMFYILDVMVDPSYRGQGIARRLVEAVVGYGKAEGFIKIFLTALPGKEGLYKSLGFSESMSPVLTMRGEDHVDGN